MFVIYCEACLTSIHFFEAKTQHSFRSIACLLVSLGRLISQCVVSSHRKGAFGVLYSHTRTSCTQSPQPRPCILFWPNSRIYTTRTRPLILRRHLMGRIMLQIHGVVRKPMARHCANTPNTYYKRFMASCGNGWAVIAQPHPIRIIKVQAFGRFNKDVTLAFERRLCSLQHCACLIGGNRHHRSQEFVCL